MTLHSLFDNISLVFSGYDSDVQRETTMDYASKTYTNPLRETTGVKPDQQEVEDDDT